MAVTLIPIVQDGLTVARLLVGSFTYPEFPPATSAALETLGKIVGTAITSFRAEQLQREARLDVEALLASLPLAIWCVDTDDRITLWNQAAERAFGWRASEVLGSRPPFSLDREATAADSQGQESRCRSRDGALLAVHATTIPLPRLMGIAAGTMTVAEIVPLDPVSGSQRTELAATAGIAELLRRKVRLLVLEHDPVQRRILRGILRDIGCITLVSSSIEEALDRYQAGMRTGRRIDLVICELLPPSGLGGLSLASRLIRLDPQAKIVLSADSPITGSESHGLAGTLRRPYAESEVKETIGQCW